MTEPDKLDGPRISPISEARLAAILEIAEDAIISADSLQRIVVFNRGAERIFGYSAQEVLGLPIDVLIPQRFVEQHQNHMRFFGQSGSVARRMGDRSAIFGRRKDGSEFPAEASISRLVSDGQVLFTAMLRDITDRKQAEAAIHRLNEDLEQRVEERTRDLQSKHEEIRAMTQQLWHAAKLASVGELAASIAHELNNPLATVSLRIETLLAQTPADDPRRRLLEVIEQEIERMGGLVANVLQFSRRGQEQVSTVEIPRELDKALELVRYHLRKRRIDVRQEFAADTPVIHADRQKLRQVFLNLLTNASDAMPKGGTLTLRASAHQMPMGDRGILIEFVDTGIGIEEEDLARVMEPFFTTKDEGKGTGLGLAICRRVVQEHHGTIQIESSPGKGTAVKIALPIVNMSNVSYLGQL